MISEVTFPPDAQGGLIIQTMNAPLRLKGRRFGKLVVIDGPRKMRMPSGTPRRLWLCRCDCGKEREYTGGELTAGLTKSCGCLRRPHGERRAAGGKPTSTYNTWAQMHQRCEDKLHTNYANYGGRGIKVCARWRKYENFLADMGERPAGHSLDRYPDYNGNYEPSNCRWATQKQQARNRRGLRKVQFNGESLCVAELVERTGISREALVSRLDRGLSVDDAVREATQRKERHDRLWSRANGIRQKVRER